MPGSEPSNVAACGGACPLRFRCVGCYHFSTDVSYLPELHAYLDDLLCMRERLRSMAEADDWARAEASPSDEEIRRVRHLIQRATEDDQLTAAESRRSRELRGTSQRRRDSPSRRRIEACWLEDYRAVAVSSISAIRARMAGFLRRCGGRMVSEVMWAEVSWRTVNRASDKFAPARFASVRIASRRSVW